MTVFSLAFYFVSFLPQVAPKQMEFTLAIIKPDASKITFICKHVKSLLQKEGFKIVLTKQQHMQPAEAHAFYKEHREKFYFRRLLTYMCSGPIWIHVLARNDAVNYWRKMIGPTHVYRAQFSHPNSLRAYFGLTDTRNTFHGSDSIESAKKEIAFFFPDFSGEKFETALKADTDVQLQEVEVIYV